MKELSPDAIERGIACLRRMRRIVDSYGATLRAVATSAVREAVNAGVFLDRARREAGIEIEVDLRRRGGPPDPPRRAAGRAGVRPPAAARRHRRRLDRAADRREGRDAGRAQLQARRRPPHRPLLPRRRGDRRSRSRPAGSTCAASSATSSARSTSTASTSPWPRRARPRRSPASPTPRTGAEPLRTYNCFEFTADEVHGRRHRARPPPHRGRRGPGCPGSSRPGRHRRRRRR